MNDNVHDEGCEEIVEEQREPAEVFEEALRRYPDTLMKLRLSILQGKHVTIDSFIVHDLCAMGLLGVEISSESRGRIVIGERFVPFLKSTTVEQMRSYAARAAAMPPPESGVRLASGGEEENLAQMTG